MLAIVQMSRTPPLNKEEVISGTEAEQLYPQR
jgi:hypothetical protein